MLLLSHNIKYAIGLYPGIAPGCVYYIRPTIAAFAITGTNPYYWALTDPRGSIILNKCYNTITGTNPYSSNRPTRRAGTLNVPARRHDYGALDRNTGIPSSKQAST